MLTIDSQGTDGTASEAVGLRAEGKEHDMSISGIGGVSPNTGVFGPQRPNFRDNMQQVMSSVGVRARHH